MGVIRRGILGGFAGKVANVVGSSWKGIAVIKSLPLSVANPNTAGQVAQRTKMTNIVAFAQAILVDIIKPLNDRFASGQSGFNLFVQRNIALFATAAPNPLANLIISRGTVTGFEDLSAEANNGSTDLQMSWTDNTGVGNALATDQAYICARNRTTGEFALDDGSIQRDAVVGTALSFPSNLVTGQNIDIWAAYRRADGTQVSDSQYVTTVVVA